ncbi:DUF1934 domain-containing protein [Paenibacillus hodogayensis]|uniref:DUF1934 domain-containing protein n=1 Tax=Paenibacillus hodogayensis TaxID=279208 RepID=A0ABV5W193_9BACL
MTKPETPVSRKRRVRVRIESRQSGQKQSWLARGELYAVNGMFYLRYDEPDTDMGRTTATVKWDESHIKVIRHGDVRSDLTFRSGTRTVGSYELPQGRMELEVMTHGIDRKLTDGLGMLSWSYDMVAGGAPAGRMRLALTIEEELTE